MCLSCACATLSFYTYEGSQRPNPVSERAAEEKRVRVVAGSQWAAESSRCPDQGEQGADGSLCRTD